MCWYSTERNGEREWQVKLHLFSQHKSDNGSKHWLRVAALLLPANIKLFQRVEHMAVLREEPRIWNHQFLGFNPIPATNAASYPSSPHFRVPDPVWLVDSVSLSFSIHLSGADKAVPPHLCRLVTVQEAFQTQSYIQFLQTTQPLKIAHPFREKNPKRNYKKFSCRRPGLSG